jgi:hypothetical protein
MATTLLEASGLNNARCPTMWWKNLKRAHQ